MQTRLIEKEGVSAKFEVTVPAQEVDKTFETVLRNVARQVRVPGFRPGKAPRGVIIKQIGQDALNQEVRDALVETHYPKAVGELELQPIHAHFDAAEPSEGSDFTFEVAVDLYPEFSLPDLSEIIIDTAAPPLTDDMVTEAAAELQRENAVQIPVERAIEPGDYVLVETLREGEASGSVLPIDLERVDEAFAAQLIGKSVNDEVELNLAAGQEDDTDGEDGLETSAEAVDTEAGDAETGETDEADSEASEAGADESNEAPRLKVVIKDVKEKEKPALDDDFAKTLGFETWAEVETKIRENLQSQLDADTFEAQREEFTEKLVEETAVELPLSLVNRRKANLLNNLAQDLQRNGIGLEAYLKNLDDSGKREEFDQELQESAEQGVKRDLVLERLLEERGSTLSDDEFNSAVAYMASREGQDAARFRREMGNDWLENYRFLLSRDKAIRETVRGLLGQDETDTDDVDETDVDETDDGGANEVTEAEESETED